MSTTTTDPIADMLTRIRNAMAAGKSEVLLPHSKIKESVAILLKDNGFIKDVIVTDANDIKTMTISLVEKLGTTTITEIVRLSRPGRRHYVGVNDIPVVKRGRGIVILSTSRGIMTGDSAIKERVGGELICRIY